MDVGLAAERFDGGHFGVEVGTAVDQALGPETEGDRVARQGGRRAGSRR